MSDQLHLGAAVPERVRVCGCLPFPDGPGWQRACECEGERSVPGVLVEDVNTTGLADLGIGIYDVPAIDFFNSDGHHALHRAAHRACYELGDIPSTAVIW